MIIDRIAERAKIRKDNSNNIYNSTYQVLEKITDEVVSQNKDLVNNITLGDIPLNALESKILKIINHYNFRVLGKTRDELKKDILDNIFGYGILQKYLDIKDVNGIFVNGPDNIWIQIGNKREKIKESFGSNKNITSYIRSIKAKLGGEINENRPLAKFQDSKNKLRIVACISPVAHVSPTIVFRKHRDRNYTLNDLINLNMLTKELADDLNRYNQAGANIVICGRGGAGKTTLARALLEELNPNTRILVMEEHPELFLNHSGAIQMLVKRNDIGHVTGLSELTDMGLLMTIDRYMFGEIRGSEAMSFFKGALAGNITMNTVHARNARDAINMLMINMKMAGTDLDSETLFEILYNSIDIIIFMDSFTVTEVVEVVNERKNKFNDLWKFQVENRESTFIEGKHVKVGNISSNQMKIKLSESGFIREGEEKCS